MPKFTYYNFLTQQTNEATIGVDGGISIPTIPFGERAEVHYALATLEALKLWPNAQNLFPLFYVDVQRGLYLDVVAKIEQFQKDSGYKNIQIFGLKRKHHIDSSEQLRMPTAYAKNNMGTISISKDLQEAITKFCNLFAGDQVEVQRNWTGEVTSYSVTTYSVVRTVNDFGI